jgi:GNAT superfamily N-acetyltransferase
MTGSDLHISELDVHDDETFAAWHGAYAAALDAAVGDAASTWTLPELQVQMREPTRDLERHGFVGRVGGPDGEVVAAGFAGFPQLDNLESAYLETSVHPDHQGRGHGTALAVHVEEFAVAAGRRLLTCEVRWRGDQGPDGEGSPGAALARSRGFKLGLTDVQRRLEHRIPDDVLDALAAEAAPHHTGYRLDSFIGPMKDEYVESWLALANTLMVEAPTGDIEREAERTDLATLREQEANIEKQGRTLFTTVALDDAGDVVAFTTIAHGVHDSSGAFQWGTQVHRDHRGHRLGLAVKVANHRLFQAERPDVERVSTYNAESNVHMIAVNERLGFQPVSRMGEFQKRVAD